MIGEDVIADALADIYQVHLAWAEAFQSHSVTPEIVAEKQAAHDRLDALILEDLATE